MTSVAADQNGLRVRVPREVVTAVEAMFAADRRVCRSQKGACGCPACRSGV
jgi:hypothetical protein